MTDYSCLSRGAPNASGKGCLQVNDNQECCIRRTFQCLHLHFQHISMILPFPHLASFGSIQVVTCMVLNQIHLNFFLPSLGRKCHCWASSLANNLNWCRNIFDLRFSFLDFIKSALVCLSRTLWSKSAVLKLRVDIFTFSFEIFRRKRT